MTDEDYGYGISYQYLTGFVDYSWRFSQVEPIWLVIGSIFFTVSFISYIPQPVEIIKARSSYGIEPLSSFCSNWGEFLVFVNLICFRSLDFVGLLQYHYFTCFPRILTFFNLFFAWIMNQTETFQLFIFHDREYRESRNQKLIRKDWIKSVCYAILLIVIDLGLLVIFVTVNTSKGFEHSLSTAIGEICGTIATCLEFAFFIPQMYTTCKLQDAGSLSLLMLEIEGPSDLANALYMWFGTGDHWTTWITLLLSSFEVFTLLGTCMIFRCIKARRLKEMEKLNLQSRSLNASLEPEILLFEKF